MAIVNALIVTSAVCTVIVLFLFARDLPSHDALLSYEPPVITQVRSGDGAVLDEFATERRIYTPADEIPELVKRAFVSAEDKNFYQHNGFDVRAMGVAMVDAFRSRGETLRGASTITQQVMKNFLLSGDPIVERKIKEIILSNRIERVLGKEKILELYLNEIFLGQKSYGVAAAAQAYFNKTLPELSLREAAVLAALPKAPSELHPVRNMTGLRARRNYVLREMHENGFISREVYETEIWEPLQTVQTGDFPDYADTLPPRSYFTDEIRRQLSTRIGEEAVLSGGLTIRASIDDRMQDAAARALRRGLESYDRRRGLWRPTGLTIDPSRLGDEAAWRAALADTDMPRDIDLDGKWHPAVVLELSGRDARIGIEGVAEDAEGHWIRARDLTWARRIEADGTRGPGARAAGDLVRPGEVIHVRAVTAGGADEPVRWSLRQIPELQGGFMAMEVASGRVIALQGGFSFQQSPFNRTTQALRQPGSSFKPIVFAAALEHGFSPSTIVSDGPITIDTGGGVWRPKNASHGHLGRVPLSVGLVRSRNLMTVRLAQAIGMDTVADYAERFGVYDDMKEYAANALGAEETTLFRMVAAYAALANGGRRVVPTLVDEVRDRHGRRIDLAAEGICRTCEATAGPDAPGNGPPPARAQVVDPITAHHVTSMMQGVVERGTASRAINLPYPVAGKTGTTNDSRDVWFVGYSSGIVAGCFMGFDQPRSMGPGAYGGTMCAPVFQEFMEEAGNSYAFGDFAAPPEDRFLQVERMSGRSDPASGPGVVTEGVAGDAVPGVASGFTDPTGAASAATASETRAPERPAAVARSAPAARPPTTVFRTRPATRGSSVLATRESTGTGWSAWSAPAD